MTGALQIRLLGQFRAAMAQRPRHEPPPAGDSPLADRLGVDPDRDSTPARLAFVARAMMDTAFNVWYDQRRKDVAGLVAELFRKLKARTKEHRPNS